MDDQGAYEGLALVAEVSLADGRWDWHGYIVDGELPPATKVWLYPSEEAAAQGWATAMSGEFTAKVRRMVGARGLAPTLCRYA